MPEYDEQKWANDPGEYAEPDEAALFESWQRRGLKPEDFTDPETVTRYRAWLAAHPK